MIPVVKFYPLEKIPKESLVYVVIVAQCGEQWVFCQHRDRTTWECPGGHVEPKEEPIAAAHRELYEETGARTDELKEVCIYSVGFEQQEETFGLLCFARIEKVGELPENSEMESVRLFEKLPENWTYPHIQPLLLEYVKKRLHEKALLCVGCAGNRDVLW